MRKLKFVVALFFMSFCFFANAESVSTDLITEKISQNINVSIDTPKVTTIDTLLKDQNIDLLNFDSNTSVFVRYKSLARLKPNDLYAGISDNQFYRLTSVKSVSSDRPYNSVEKYKPHITYQF